MQTPMIKMNCRLQSAAGVNIKLMTLQTQAINAVRLPMSDRMVKEYHAIRLQRVVHVLLLVQCDFSLFLVRTALKGAYSACFILNYGECYRRTENTQNLNVGSSRSHS